MPGAWQPAGAGLRRGGGAVVDFTHMKLPRAWLIGLGVLGNVARRGVRAGGGGGAGIAAGRGARDGDDTGEDHLSGGVAGGLCAGEIGGTGGMASGERGADLKKVAKHGPPKLVEAGRDFPFILLSPQCPTGQWWDLAALDAWLDEVVRKYRVDADRIYLTGLSMGGYGTWGWAQRVPGRFAAIVPVCGGGDPAQGEKLKGLPVWAFHGDKDTAVPVVRTEEMIAAIKAAGGEPRVTIYPGVAHDSWTEAYATEDVYTWMLSKRRGGAD